MATSPEEYARQKDLHQKEHTHAGGTGSVSHSSLTGVTSDQHHAKSHAHDGADGSGTVAHSATTGKTANDHHNQAHTQTDHTSATTADIADVAAAESAGVATSTPRGDHVHAHGTGYLADAHHAQSHSDSDHTAGFGSPTGNIDIGDAAAAGAATTHSRSDHQHAFTAPSANYPTQVDIGDAQTDGSATTPARSDHQHAVPAPASGYPVDVAATEADGTATTVARADHKHAHGTGYAGGHTDAPAATHGDANHSDTTNKRGWVIVKGNESGFAAYWPDGSTKSAQFMFYVPSNYASGDLVFNFWARGSTSGSVTNKTVVTRLWVYRFRVNTAVTTIDNNVNIDYTFPISTSTSTILYFQRTVTAANFQAGDVIRLDVQRLGADAGDTYAGDFDFDGAWVEYTATGGA